MLVNNYIMDENSDLKERLLSSSDLNLKKILIQKIYLKTVIKILIIN